MTSVYPDHHASIALQKKLHARGWGAPSWPREYGGCEWSAVQRYLFARERLTAGAPPPPLGIHMIGPALIRFGTPAQHARFLPGPLSDAILWTQGSSAPESGSDLAYLTITSTSDADDPVSHVHNA